MQIIDKNSDELLYNAYYKDLSNLFTVAKTDGEQHYLINKSIYIKGASNPTASNFGTYIKKETDTWPLMSYKIYGEIDLWWLLCKVNNIIDPTAEITNGAEIRYLKKEVVDSILNGMKSQ